MAFRHPRSTRPALLACTIGAVALSGWGAFATSGRSASALTLALREQVQQGETERGQLAGERARLQQDLAALQERLASAQTEQGRTLRARDQAKAELTAAQQQVATLSKRLEAKERAAAEARERAAHAPPAPPPAPARGGAGTKQRVVQADAPLVPPARIPERTKAR